MKKIEDNLTKYVYINIRGPITKWNELKFLHDRIQEKLIEIHQIENISDLRINLNNHLMEETSLDLDIDISFRRPMTIEEIASYNEEQNLRKMQKKQHAKQRKQEREERDLKEFERLKKKYEKSK